MSGLSSFRNWPELEATLSAGSDTKIANEDAYKALWQRLVASQQDLGLLAVQGGLLADRLAWVFVAGYQAALRRTFPDQGFSGWAAFAVSEDRRAIRRCRGWIIRTWILDLAFQVTKPGSPPSMPLIIW